MYVALVLDLYSGIYHCLRLRVAGDIGGSMGLLIGASVITIVEALDAFATTCARRRRKNELQRLRASNAI